MNWKQRFLSSNHPVDNATMGCLSEWNWSSHSEGPPPSAPF
ncbi:hypothetical protein LINGRAHAP2_LOCUS28347 [Linum grandiflorum]